MEWINKSDRLCRYLTCNNVKHATQSIEGCGGTEDERDLFQKSRKEVPLPEPLPPEMKPKNCAVESNEKNKPEDPFYDGWRMVLDIKKQTTLQPKEPAADGPKWEFYEPNPNKAARIAKGSPFHEWSKLYTSKKGEIICRTDMIPPLYIEVQGDVRLKEQRYNLYVPRAPGVLLPAYVLQMQQLSRTNLLYAHNNHLVCAEIIDTIEKAKAFNPALPVKLLSDKSGIVPFLYVSIFCEHDPGSFTPMNQQAENSSVRMQELLWYTQNHPKLKECKYIMHNSHMSHVWFYYKHGFRFHSAIKQTTLTYGDVLLLGQEVPVEFPQVSDPIKWTEFAQTTYIDRMFFINPLRTVFDVDAWEKEIGRKNATRGYRFEHYYTWVLPETEALSLYSLSWRMKSKF